jgi:hypothetical protein
MASNSVESEATFEKTPFPETRQQKDMHLDTDSAPFGPIAPLKTFKTSSSSSVDQRVEDVFYDKDLPAAEGVVNLYQDGVEVSRIHRILSIGMLGLQKKQKISSY